MFVCRHSQHYKLYSSTFIQLSNTLGSSINWNMHAGGKLCAVVFFNTSKIYWTIRKNSRKKENRKKNTHTHTILCSKNEFIFQFVSFVHSWSSLSFSLYHAISLLSVCFTERVKYQDYHIFFFFFKKKFIINEVSAMVFDIFV